MITVVIASRFRNLVPRPRPRACGRCGSETPLGHCGKRDCPWVYCPDCKHITGMVLGRQRAVIATTPPPGDV